MDKTFDPKTLADDLSEVHRICSRFSAALDETGWDKPVKFKFQKELQSYEHKHINSGWQHENL